MSKNTQYLGPELVVEKKEINKTPLGAPVYEVTTEALYDGEKRKFKRIYTQPAFDAVVSDEMTDWNYFRDKKFRTLVNQITEQAIEYGITGEEMDPLLMAAGRNFATMLDKAVYKKWFGNTEEYVPGGTSFHGFSLLEAHYEIHGTGNNTDTTGEGSDTADKA